MNRRRIYMTLELWSQKRRASAEAVATIRESFRPAQTSALPGAQRLNRNTTSRQ